MDAHEVIIGRRTIKQFLPDPIPREILAQLLDLAVWAPNHGRTEPWQFHVLGGQAKERVARIQQRLKVDRHEQPGSEAAQLQGEVAYREFATPPYLIVVSSTGKDQAHWKRVQEDYAATCCAVQNFMLAAWAQGIGSYWRTGPLIFDAELYTLTGLDPSRQVVGVIMVGRPARVPKGVRTPAAEKTVWLVDGPSTGNLATPSS